MSSRKVTLGDGTEAVITDGTGEVHDDGVDALGLALRLGLGNPSSEVAAQYFPAMELMDGEERPDPGETVGGVPVFCWATQSRAAKMLRVSTRWLMELEGRGLPHRGERSTKRYPLPHVVVWYGEYKRNAARSNHVERLTFPVAWARHRLRLAEEEAGR